jgi:hypothetical protein
MKKNEIKEMHSKLRHMEDSGVLEQIKTVEIIVHTKDGSSLKSVVKGSEMRKRLYMMQTLSNCVGFPAAQDMELAALESIIKKPGPLLRDYMSGKLDCFFASRYRSAFYEIRSGRHVLRLPMYPKDKFYYIGNRKGQFEIEMSICDYLHKQKSSKK